MIGTISMITARLFTVPELFSNTHVHWLAREEGGGGGAGIGEASKNLRSERRGNFSIC